MARKPRIHFPGAWYHVILRGNAGDPIFFDDCDRCRLYLILHYAVENFHLQIHAFCLMRNHLHLVVQVGEVPLSRIMQNVSLRYTKWINHTRSRTGHLFQGRYKAILVDVDSYLLELVRYVHLNPVRVNAAATPEEYPWSSHRAYLGTERIPWLSTELVLAMLSTKTDQARRAYAAFVTDGLKEGRRDEFHRGTCDERILGGELFAEDVLVKANQERERFYTLDEVIEGVCSHFRIEPEKLRAPGKIRPMTKARAVAAAIVRMSPHLRLSDLAAALGRDLSSLGKAAQRIATQTGTSEIIGQVLDRLNARMSECLT